MRYGVKTEVSFLAAILSSILFLNERNKYATNLSCCRRRVVHIDDKHVNALRAQYTVLHSDVQRFFDARANPIFRKKISFILQKFLMILFRHLQKDFGCNFIYPAENSDDCFLVVYT